MNTADLEKRIETVRKAIVVLARELQALTRRLVKLESRLDGVVHKR